MVTLSKERYSCLIKEEVDGCDDHVAYLIMTVTMPAYLERDSLCMTYAESCGWEVWVVVHGCGRTENITERVGRERVMRQVPCRVVLYGEMGRLT